MARIHFGSQFARLVATQSFATDAAELRPALETAFAAHPLLRGYVLDEQGHLRQHVAVFIDGALVQDRASLREPLLPHSEIYILPALSGG
jgi:molybdopterin converting factor small subunit